MMYDDDPGEAVLKKAWYHGSDWVARLLRMILLSVALVGVVFSVLVLRSCAFAKVKGDLDLNTTAPEEVELLDDETEVFSTLGLYRANPTGLGCTDYAVDKQDLQTGIRAARACGVLALIIGAAALLLLLTEFLCCRFWCSRVIIVFSMILAAFLQAGTFSVFAIDRCFPKGLVYVCSLDEGGVYAIIASCLFLASSFLTCVTPKAVPLIRMMRDMEQHSIIDPCCCWAGRSRQDILDEHDSLMVEECLPSEVVEGVQGYEYKQYYDSKAGVTLQDQQKAAYTHWMACEEGYDRTLDRFKNECAEAEMSWREVMKTKPEDIEDQTLSRLVVILEAQLVQCMRAKEDLERFRLELDIASTPVEVRDVEMVDELMLVEGYDPDANDEMTGREKWRWIHPWRWRKRKKGDAVVEADAMEESVKEGEELTEKDAAGVTGDQATTDDDHGMVKESGTEQE